MFKLRPYQKQASEAGCDLATSKKQKNGLIVLPTATGKSLVIADIINETQKKTIVLQPTKEILEQNESKIRMTGLTDIGIFSASMGQKIKGQVTIATIGTIIKYKEAFEDCQLLIVDEAHDVNSKGGQYEEFISHLGIPVIGLTATPFRMKYYNNTFGNGEHVVESRFLTRTRPRIFNTIAHITQVPDMFEQGYLCPIEYDYKNDYDSKKIKSNSTGQGYDETALEKYNQQQDIVGKIIHEVRNSDAGHILIFTHFKSESKQVIEGLAKHNVQCEEVSGETKREDRERILSQFKSGVIRCVVNVGVLCLDEKTEILTDEGFKNIDELKYSHKVACWNTDNSIYFENPKFIIRRKRFQNEAMIFSKGNSIDFRVTEYHRMVFKSGRNRIWKEKLAKDFIGKKFDFPCSGFAAPSEIKIPDKIYTKKQINRKIVATSYNYRKNGLNKKDAFELAKDNTLKKCSLKYTQPNELTLSDCKFIGFWLGDGTNGSTYSISQSFRYQNIINWFEKILEDSDIYYSDEEFKPEGFSFHIKRWHFPRGTGGNKQFISNGIYRLEPYLDKNGSKYLWGLNKDQFNALLEGLWYADGEHGSSNTYEKSKNKWRIKGAQYKLYNLLQSIGICRGFRSNLTPIKLRNNKHSQQYSFRWQARISTSIGWAKPQKEIEYKNERVWCVTSNSSFIVTRRNGKITITGNTVGFDFPELDHIIFGRPTKSINLFYQISGRGLRIAEGKTHCKLTDLCDNIKRFGEINSFVIEDTNGNGLWRLKSNIGYLTGVNLLTGQDLEERNITTKKEKEKVKTGDIIIPFGKYKDNKLKEVNDDYLKWAINKFDAGKWKTIFNNELTRRAGNAN